MGWSKLLQPSTREELAMEYWQYQIFPEELAADKLGTVLTSTKWLFQQFWDKLGRR